MCKRNPTADVIFYETRIGFIAYGILIPRL